MTDDLITSLRALAADLARASAADVSVAVDAMIEIERLRSDLDTATRERDEARAEVERLREALQEATLAAHGCAQCRDEIGRICHEALEAKPCAWDRGNISPGHFKDNSKTGSEQWQ